MKYMARAGSYFFTCVAYLHVNEKSSWIYTLEYNDTTAALLSFPGPGKIYIYIVRYMEGVGRHSLHIYLYVYVKSSWVSALENKDVVVFLFVTIVA